MRDADLNDVFAWGLLLTIVGSSPFIVRLPTMVGVGRWLIAHDVLTGPAQSLITVEALGAGFDARRLVILVSLVLVLAAALLRRRLGRGTRAVPR